MRPDRHFFVYILSDGNISFTLVMRGSILPATYSVHIVSYRLSRVCGQKCGVAAIGPLLPYWDTPHAVAVVSFNPEPAATAAPLATPSPLAPG